MRALDHPTMPSEPLAAFDATAGNTGLDAALSQITPTNDSVIGAGITSGLFSVLGYGAGKVADDAINFAMKPTINHSVNWANSGVWSGHGYNIFMPNNVGAVGATSMGGTIQEGVQSMFDNQQNQRKGR
ncbi:hypothetical protein [Burkholderia plantarii]|uniref:hypothetical protein n=1 Tax=Burkholderia plantarii TaxID=41899 RepID=UPI00272C3D0A|nr:hypothetical protein [Burkholderia plantarii]